MQPDIIMDVQPAQNAADHSQYNWIRLYNAQRGEFKGKRMINSADVIGVAEHVSLEAFVNLQGDYRQTYVVSSTRTSYDSISLAGNVTHNYISLVARPKIISLDEIPVLRGVPLSRVVETSSGLLYVKALADDEHASAKDLLTRHSILAGREPNEIAYWTPTLSSRMSYPEKAIRFNDNGDRFHVVGCNYFGGSIGHSRGVLINPRSGRAKKVA